jgi:cytochrome c oxidase assembly protein subunit 15
MNDLPSMIKLAALALVVASLPLSWWWLRQRGASTRARLAALTVLTTFLTFDLIVFGAFTRLTDSGLGCPDWPGCYGQASPLAARADIHAAEQVLPDGPVTWAKAWIEMIHRYLAMTVGVLIMVAAAVGWRIRRELPHSPWWGFATLAWVIVQGLFGKYTVTWKLYPAIVTAHLLVGIVLLGLLVLQHESFRDRPLQLRIRTGLIATVLVLLVIQIALGGWVSTNYAVLACSGFPSCNGQWWPPMDFAQGFAIARELGHTADGRLLPFEALVAVHWVHRAFAVVAIAAVLGLAWRLWHEDEPAARRYGAMLAVLVLAQFASGLTNVVLDWPIVAALFHSAGAAAMAGVLTSLWARRHQAESSRRTSATVPWRVNPAASAR